MDTPRHLDYRQLEEELESGLSDLESRPYPGRNTLGLAVLAAATAAGDRPRLRVGLKRARVLGISAEEIRETLLQTYLFAGYPRAINALADFSGVFHPDAASATIDLKPRPEDEVEWLAAGQALCREVYGERYPKLLDTMARVDADLGRWMVMEGYGKVLSRTGLAKKKRELTAVAALIPLSVPAQLRAHLRGAFLVGACREDIEGVIDAASLVSSKHRETARRLLQGVIEDDL